MKSDSIDIEYETQLAQEALIVGAANIAGFVLFSKLLPKASPLLHVFLAGVTIHLGFETFGLNDIYLTSSAASLKHSREHYDNYKVPNENRDSIRSYRCSISSSSGYASPEELSQCIKSQPDSGFR